MKELIVAISTPPGVGGISIIRVVGKEVFEFIDKIYYSSSKITTNKKNTIRYGKIIYGDKLIDEVLVSKFCAPHSFTGENTIEINCHGGTYVTKKIVKILLEQGARIAEKGEFSKLAFLNGKRSLSELASTLDVIGAFSESTYAMAISGMSGAIDVEIDLAYNILLELKGNISVAIDYPEYIDVEKTTNSENIKSLKSVILTLKSIIEDTKRGAIYKDGIDTVIIGKPNVGKSTLLNLLANEQKAIVSNIAGTTRDTIEVNVLLDDVRLNLLDTAGIRDTTDEIEMLGIQKSFEMIEKAELVIFVTDSSTTMSKEEKEIYKLLMKKKKIILNNKIEIKKTTFFKEQINISFFDKGALDIIEREMKKIFNLESFEPANSRIIAHEYALDLLEKAVDSLENLVEEVEHGILEDLLEIELNEIISNLGEIIGKTIKEDYLNDMFSRFCLGK